MRDADLCRVKVAKPGLVIFPKQFKIRLWMSTCRTLLWRAFSFMQVAAIATTPGYLFIPFENTVRFDVKSKVKVSFFHVVFPSTAIDSKTMAIASNSSSRRFPQSQDTSPFVHNVPPAAAVFRFSGVVPMIPAGNWAATSRSPPSRNLKSRFACSFS